MVKVNLGSMNGHISSVNATSAQRIASLQQVISSLDQFASAGSLQGQAYTNAKNFGQDVLRTLAQGLIVYSEQLSESASRLGSLYASLVGDESLDESVLRANIASYQASLAHQSSIYNRLMGEDILNFRSLNSLHNAMSITNASLQREQEKLDKLLTFNSQSASVFSDLSQLEKSITSGFSSVRSSFGQHASLGGFSIPDKMAWKKDLDDRWKERIERMRDTSSPADFRKLEEREQEEYIKSVEVERSYQDLAKKVEKGEALTEEDIAIINAYAKLHPDGEPSQQIMGALDDYYYGFDDIPRSLISKFADPKEWTKEWSWATVGKILDDANEIAIQQGKNLGRVFGAKLQPRDALGHFVKDTIKPRSWLSGKLKGVSNSTSKIIGHSAKLLGFGVSTFLEGADHYSKYKNVGRAVSYGTVGGIVALGAGAVAGAIGTAFALPVIGTLAVGIVVGAVASAGLKAAYENIKPVRDIIDGAGDLLNNGVKAISDGVNSIGKAFSNPIGSLKGAFGW